MKYLRVGVPFAVVLACLLNGIMAYSSDNNMALMGYITAICGWITIAYDEYLTYRKENRRA